MEALKEEMSFLQCLYDEVSLFPSPEGQVKERAEEGFLGFLFWFLGSRKLSIPYSSRASRSFPFVTRDFSLAQICQNRNE